jgi:RHS repeat-associated protein
MSGDAADTSDGLGRQASFTDQSKYGTQTTSNVYDGTSLIQSTSSAQGASTLVRDAAGSLAEHVSANGEATWDLLDGLGSTIAGGTGGSITELASYDDWGAQRFETDGWSAPESYTGHAQDATQGLIHTFARSYDVATGTWTAPDTWRGLLSQPKSLARYQYAWGNPTTNWDPDGHVCAKRGSTDALPLGCGAPPAQAYDNVKMPPAPPPYTSTNKNAPKATGPNSVNRISPLHLDTVNFKVPSVALPTTGSGTATCGSGLAPTLCNWLNNLPSKPNREFGQPDGKKAMELWAVLWDGTVIAGEVFTGSLNEQDLGALLSDLYDYLIKSYAPTVVIAPGKDPGQWTIYGPPPPGGLS